ncbi:hypothetical protein GCM10009746_22000 [Microbacterium paludicola]
MTWRRPGAEVAEVIVIVNCVRAAHSTVSGAARQDEHVHPVRANKSGTHLSAAATTLECMNPIAHRTLTGGDRRSVAQLLLALGTAALMFLGIWTSSAHESLESTSVLSVTAAAADTPASHAEVSVALTSTDDELGTGGMCLLGALCGVLLALIGWRALGGLRPTAIMSAAGPSLSALLPRVRTFSPAVTPALLGISRT